MAKHTGEASTHSARLRDYAVERLGLSARLLHNLAHVDQALAKLPRIECAFLTGEIPWTTVRLLARVAKPADETANRCTRQGCRRDIPPLRPRAA